MKLRTDPSKLLLPIFKVAKTEQAGRRKTRRKKMKIWIMKWSIKEVWNSSGLYINSHSNLGLAWIVMKTQKTWTLAETTCKECVKEVV